MTDYIFTGETLDGKTVEGDLVHDGQDRTYILMDVMDHIERDDYSVYMVEVRPSSVRLNTETICDQAEQIDNLKAEVERLRDENRLLDKLKVWCIENADHNPHVSNILDDLDNLRKPEQAKE